MLRGIVSSRAFTRDDEATAGAQKRAAQLTVVALPTSHGSLARESVGLVLLCYGA